MRVLEVLREEPRECSYLADKTATLDHRILVDVTAVELETMLERGWRRFGPDYFRPACGGCTSCIPTRVPTATFCPSKSQQRARKKVSHLGMRLGEGSGAAVAVQIVRSALAAHGQMATFAEAGVAEGA